MSDVIENYIQENELTNQEAANNLGVSVATITNLRTGRTGGDQNTLEQISRATGIAMEELEEIRMKSPVRPYQKKRGSSRSKSHKPATLNGNNVRKEEVSEALESAFITIFRSLSADRKAEAVAKITALAYR